MNKMEPQAGNTEQTERGEEEDNAGKKGKGQRTCMNDPRKWTTVWELTVGARGGMGRGGQKGKIGITVVE